MEWNWEKTLVLTLTQMEAEILKYIVQNPATGEESTEDREFREELFGILKKALDG